MARLEVPKSHYSCLQLSKAVSESTHSGERSRRYKAEPVR